MKPVINKKLIVQILTIELVRILFISAMVLGVVAASNGNNQMDINPHVFINPHMIKNTLILSKRHLLSKNHPPSQKEQIPPSVSGRKAEHLYNMFIIQTARHYQIDPALIKAIIMAESGYNTKATSKRGAKGLMQLMPKTAKAMGVEDILNPHQNITGGVQYFKQLVNRFNGDVRLALAAYNAGSRNVRDYKGIPPFRETRYYIKKVFKYYQIYKDQMVEEIDTV